METRDRIIVDLTAIDSAEEAIRCVDRLPGHTGYFRIGARLQRRGEFHRLLKRVYSTGGKVCLDIEPAGDSLLVARIVSEMIAQGVTMFLIQVNADQKTGYVEGETMRAAARRKSSGVLIIADPLFSLPQTAAVDRDVKKRHYQGCLWRFSVCAKVDGADGILCLPPGLEYMHRIKHTSRGEPVRDLLRVVKDVRPKELGLNDYGEIDAHRGRKISTRTPIGAIEHGADFIIIDHADFSRQLPVWKTAADRLKRITEEVAQALQKRSTKTMFPKDR